MPAAVSSAKLLRDWMVSRHQSLRCSSLGIPCKNSIVAVACCAAMSQMQACSIALPSRPAVRAEFILRAEHRLVSHHQVVAWSEQNSIFLALMGSVFVPSRAPWRVPCMLQYAVAGGCWKQCIAKFLNNVTLPIIQQRRWVAPAEPCCSCTPSLSFRAQALLIYKP